MKPAIHTPCLRVPYVFVVLRALVTSYFAPCLLAILLLLPSCGRQADTAIPTVKIVSPHGSAIRLEFERAFARWHQQKYGTPVQVEWRSSGGTKEIQKYLDTVYARGASADIDLIFGGGSAVFDTLLKSGYLEPANPPLTPEMLAGMARTAAGTPLFGAHDLWIAATMSNFGFVVNKTRLAELHLPRPTTWKDLTGPGWIGNLAVADPSKSGSVATCYEMILQQYGWKTGWPILVKIFANAESIQISGPAPGDEAGTGNAVAGIVIDFYGRTAIIKQGSDLMEFIVPVGGSTLDPDPIAILKGAPNPTLASHFLEFIASEAGQRLWIQRPGTPGGPERKALGRMATIPQLYETAAPYLTDPSNPFTIQASLKTDVKIMRQRTSFVGETIKAALIDNHTELQAARRAVQAAGDPPELLALFDELPFEESQTGGLAERWKDKANQPPLRNQWRQHFHDLFESIMKKCPTR